MENHFEDQGSHARPTAPSAAQAQGALDDIARDGEALATHIVTPWWYHPALGVITGIFAGAQALPGVWPVVAMVAGIAAIPVLTSTYARRYGVVVSKPAGPRSRRILLTTLTVLVAAMVTSLVFKFGGVDPWWALVPAVITFVATVVLGRRYDDALRQEIAAPQPDRAR